MENKNIDPYASADDMAIQFAKKFGTAELVKIVSSHDSMTARAIVKNMLGLSLAPEERVSIKNIDSIVTPKPLQVGSVAEVVETGLAQDFPLRDRYYSGRLSGRPITVTLENLGSPRDGKWYGLTRKVGNNYSISINIAPEIPGHRISLALMHELLHTINWKASVGNPRRHQACHYLAAALLTGWKAQDLKLEKHQIVLSEIIEFYSSAMRDFNSKIFSTEKWAALRRASLSK